MSKATSTPTPRKGWVDRFLGFVEWAGNLLPHPVTLFAMFAMATVVLSGLGVYFEWSAVDPRPENAAGRSPDGLVHVNSLLDSAGLRWITTHLVSNFVGFAPLGTVLVALLGVGVAEHSGLISAVIRLVILRAPKHLVTMALMFAGVVSNTASEVGYVVIIPLGAAIYYSLGRHPIAGLACAFAGVSGGYSANLLLGTVDPLLSGITTPSAQIIAPANPATGYLGYEVNPACNFYFMFASTFLITAVGTWVSLKVVEPKLGTYSKEHGDPEWLSTPNLQTVTPLEMRGLIAAAWTVALLSLGLIYLSLPPEALRGLGVPESGSILPWLGALGVGVTEKAKTAAFLEGIVAIIFVAFLIPGIVYGWIVGTIRSDNDVIKSMSKSMTSMGSYIVLVFFAAQFVKFFEWTNLGTILAVQGAQAIKAMNLDNAGVFVLFILVCALVNLIMGSASAKWTFMAPVFVPMLMIVGYSPEVIQCAYRIGDSCTNVISPMMTYFGMIFVLISRYDKRAGMGTIISTMLPYSVTFLIFWTAFFYLWVFGLGLPVGPGAPIYYEQ